jgi:hypothetical protein
MILPCRVHRGRNRVDSLPLALVVAALLFLQPGHTRGQDAAGSTFEAAGLGWLPAIPLQITAGVDTGYDDNATLNTNPEASWFTRENVVLTYDRPGGATEFYLLGIGRFSQFFDVTGRDETAGNVTMALTHNFSTRLSFYASIYAAYQKEPNFQSDVGPENVTSSYFYTSDIFSLTYHWLPRLTTVTSYTFQRTKYDDSTIGSFQDRVQGTFSEQLQYSLTRRTNLVGSYRYEVINYDTAPTDSTTNYILAGFDHHLTEHLVVHLLGGEAFRSLETAGDRADPYVESSVGYTSSNHTLTWTTSYGFESPNTQDVSVRKTLRTGVVLTYRLTSRINSTTGIYYHNDDDEGAGTRNSFELSVGLRYMIDKHFTLNVNYEHNTEGALGSTPGYSRNRYFAGLTYTY